MQNDTYRIKPCTFVKKFWKFSMQFQSTGICLAQHRSPTSHSPSTSTGVWGGMLFISKAQETDWQYLGGGCCSFQKCWKRTDNLLEGKRGMLFISKVLKMDWQYFVGGRGHDVHSISAGNGLTIFCWGREPWCPFQKCWKWTDNILLGDRGVPSFGSKQVFQPVQISRRWAQGRCLPTGKKYAACPSLEVLLDKTRQFSFTYFSCRRSRSFEAGLIHTYLFRKWVQS